METTESQPQLGILRNQLVGNYFFITSALVRSNEPQQIETSRPKKTLKELSYELKVLSMNPSTSRLHQSSFREDSLFLNSARGPTTQRDYIRTDTLEDLITPFPSSKIPEFPEVKKKSIPKVQKKPDLFKKHLEICEALQDGNEWRVFHKLRVQHQQLQQQEREKQLQEQHEQQENQPIHKMIASQAIQNPMAININITPSLRLSSLKSNHSILESSPKAANTSPRSVGPPRSFSQIMTMSQRDQVLLPHIPGKSSPGPGRSRHGLRQGTPAVIGQDGPQILAQRVKRDLVRNFEEVVQLISNKKKAAIIVGELLGAFKKKYLHLFYLEGDPTQLRDRIIQSDVEMYLYKLPKHASIFAPISPSGRIIRKESSMVVSSGAMQPEVKQDVLDDLLTIERCFEDWIVARREVSYENLSKYMMDGINSNKIKMGKLMAKIQAGPMEVRQRVASISGNLLLPSHEKRYDLLREIERIEQENNGKQIIKSRARNVYRQLDKTMNKVSQHQAKFSMNTDR